MFSSYHGDRLVWDEVERLRKAKREREKTQAEQEEERERNFVGPLMAFPVSTVCNQCGLTISGEHYHDNESGDRHSKRLEKVSEQDEQTHKYLSHRYNFPV